MDKPTVRQDAVLKFIKNYGTRIGYPPTIREIQAGMGLRSLRGVTDHLDALARKRLIRRTSQARGIVVVDGEPGGTEREASVELERGLAVAELATCILHEIGNPLSVVAGNLQLLHDELEPGDPRKEIVAELNGEVGRMSRILSVLRNFTLEDRKEEPFSDITKIVAKYSDRKSVKRFRQRIQELRDAIRRTN